jgi:circadian clock protein KaiB
MRRDGRWQNTAAGAIFSRSSPRGLRVQQPRATTFSGGCLTDKFLLKLYVAGSSPRATLAIENLKRICEKDLSGRYHLEIIDVLKNPELAEQDKILATPTLIKQLPPPLRRVIGDLSDSEKVLLGLELRQLPPAPADPKRPG